MIVGSMLDFGASFLAFLAGLFPTMDLPTWFVGFGAQFNAFFDQWSGLGAWAPWGLLTACLVASVGTWVVCAGIKLLRAIASYLPFIGGAG